MSRPLRFEGKTMEVARLRARERLGADASELNVVRCGRELSGGLFGFFQQERFVIEVEEPRTSAGPVASQRASAPERAGARPVRSEAAGQEEEAALPDHLAQLLEATTDTVGVSFDRELRGVLEDAEAVVSDAAGSTSLVAAALLPATEQGPPPQSVAPVPAAISFGAGIPSATFRERLYAAGLAEEYLPDPLFSQPALALPLRLGTIPAARPVLSRPGDVVVLVGEVGESLRVAEELARGIDEDESVLVVSHRRLAPSPSNARARSPLEAGTVVLERRLNGLVSIVVLDTLCRSGFVPRAVAGLRPDAIWGVVPASWDEKRTRALEALVGRLDALALYGMLATDRPAGLIGRGWPVAYLDGWEANPLSIAARLVEAVKAET